MLEDEFGRVNIFLLPFLKPAVVKHWAPEDAAAEITSYHDAVKYAVSQLPLVQEERNVLVAHQFVTGAVTAGSEAVNVGGLDNIGAEVLLLLIMWLWGISIIRRMSAVMSVSAIAVHR